MASIGFIGHTLIDLSWGGSPWWSWVIASAFVGVVVGLFSKKLNLQEGEFSKKQVAFFALANIVAHLLAWVLVAPVLDIAIYAEPVKKVFAQGAFAAVSNSITAVVVGGLLVLAYTKTIAKKALWIKNNCYRKAFPWPLVCGKAFCLPLCRWGRRHRNILL